MYSTNLESFLQRRALYLTKTPIMKPMDMKNKCVKLRRKAKVQNQSARPRRRASARPRRNAKAQSEATKPRCEDKVQNQGTNARREASATPRRGAEEKEKGKAKVQSQCAKPKR